MKKKILSIILAAAAAAVLMTACGGKKEANVPASTTKAETSASVTKEEKSSQAEDKGKTETSSSEADGEEMVSDEVFQILQDNFALMVKSHDAVRELYSMDEIAANADVEEVINEAADIINQMGEITQDSITEEDAIALNDAIGDILNALSAVIDEMELAEGDAAKDVVSDETFAELQKNYGILTETYNVVAEAYNSDEIEANGDIENTLNQAREIIEQMGEITQENITEADAVELTEAMVDIIEVLDLVVDAMN